MISIVSVVLLPLNVKLGKYLSRKLEERRVSRRNHRLARDSNTNNGDILSITNEAYSESEMAIEPYAISSSPLPSRSIWQRIQAAHSKLFLCNADYLIFRWSKHGKRRQHGRRERNARAREREGRGSMMRIVAQEAEAGTAAAPSANGSAVSSPGRNHNGGGAGGAGGHHSHYSNGNFGGVEEGGIELSVRRPGEAVNNHHLHQGGQIELYEYKNHNENTCSSSIQNAFKLFLSIIRYDNETKRLLQLAVPFTFTGIIFTVADLVVLGFVSQYLGTDAMIAYILVDLTVGTTSEFLGGFIEAVSSLGSMAYGAENYFMVGQYVQLATILYTVCQIPCFILWGSFMKEIVLLFGFSEGVADMAAKFVLVCLPLEITEGIHECLMDFLEVVEHELYANAFSCIAAIVEVVLIWVGLHYYDADLVFLGLICLGNSVFFLVLNVMFCIALGWLEKYEAGLIRSFSLKNKPMVKELLKTAAPLALGSMLAYAEWELLTIFAAVLGEAEIATWGVLGFVWDVCESTTEAFGDAGEVRISYQLGKGRPELAKLVAYKCMFMGLTMSMVMSTIFLSLRNVLPEFLTTDETIQDMLKMLFPIIALGNVTMSVGMVCWALVGAQLRYPLATAIATLCSFGITLPLGAVFTIVLNYDLKGLTFAVIAGYVMTAMLLSTVLLMSDWEKLSDRIRDKMLANVEDDSSSDDSSSSSSSSSEDEDDDEEEERKNDMHDNLGGEINQKKSEETDMSSVHAMHQAVPEDPHVTSPDRIVNRVVSWWG